MKVATLGLCALAITVAIPRAAAAADPAAETLYQEGRRAAQAHDWPLACKKFEESEAREPAPGTLLNLADCEENRGRLVAAAAHFDTAARLFHSGDPRVAYAVQRGLAVAARLPKLVLRLALGSPASATVECDGAIIDAAALGRPTPMDPGRHSIVVRAPGTPDARTTFQLSEGESRELVLTVGASASGSGMASGGGSSTGAASAEAPAAVLAFASQGAVEPAPKGGLSPLQTIGIVVFGVGAVGIGVGIGSGLATIGDKNTANAYCTATSCKPVGFDAESNGRTWSAVSTASFIVGGVGLAAGVGLVLAGASHSGVSAITVHPLVGGAAIGWTMRL
jgi:hypothetical protein